MKGYIEEASERENEISSNEKLINTLKVNVKNLTYVEDNNSVLVKKNEENEQQIKEMSKLFAQEQGKNVMLMKDLEEKEFLNKQSEDKIRL